MLRLGWLTKDWTPAEVEEQIMFEAVRERVVKMDVRVESPTNLYVVWNEGEVQFLCHVDAMESIEFNAPGAFSLFAEAARMYVRTADSTYVFFENTDEEIFTKMHDRRPIAPEILEMQKVVHRNMQKMKAQMMRDIDGMKRAAERQLKRDEANTSGDTTKPTAKSGEDETGNGKSSSAGGGSDGQVKEPAKDATVTK